MSIITGFRSLHRSSRVRIGGKSLNPDTTVYLNIDSARVKRDFGRHTGIQSLVTLQSHFQNDDGVVTLGGKVTNRATGLVLDVSAIQYVRGDKVTKGSGAAGTATVGAADATNPRVDTVVVDSTAGTFSVIAGTATAGTNSLTLAGRGTVPANRIVLAYVIVPATATNLTASAVVDARP